MTYQELLNICASSSAEDWHIVPSLPPIGDELDEVEDEGGDLAGYYESTHGVYKQDLAVSLLWKIHYAGRINAPWLADMGETDVDAALVDVMYCGGQVFRVPRVLVDDGRCGLPMPTARDDGTRVRYTVSEWEHRFLRLINALARFNTDNDGATLYDRSFARSGIEILE